MLATDCTFSVVKYYSEWSVISVSTRAGSLGIIDSNASVGDPVEFDLSGRLQSRYQQCMPVGNKTGADRAIL